VLFFFIILFDSLTDFIFADSILILKMALWSNFNRTNPSSRDKRYYDDEFMTKDLFDFSRSFYNAFSLFDELERRNRQVFNDPFFSGAWLTNEEQSQQQGKLEQSSTPTADNNKENQNTNNQSSNGNQKSDTMTVTNNAHHNNQNRYGSHSNWLLNPFSRLSQVSNHLVPSSISIDISESPKEYTIKASLPGVEKENIKVECDTNQCGQHYLSISAERKNEIKQENNKDKRWETDNEAWQLAREVSSLLWNYFEPHYGWKPAAGVEKLRH